MLVLAPCMGEHPSIPAQGGRMDSRAGEGEVACVQATSQLKRGERQHFLVVWALLKPRSAGRSSATPLVPWTFEVPTFRWGSAKKNSVTLGAGIRWGSRVREGPTHLVVPQRR